MKNPMEFVAEVRQEAAKITWPTWKEVWITTIMVLIMVVLATFFFLIVDWVLSYIVSTLLQFGR